VGIAPVASSGQEDLAKMSDQEHASMAGVLVKGRWLISIRMGGYGEATGAGAMLEGIGYDPRFETSGLAEV